MQSALIIGGDGFIGSALSYALKASGNAAVKTTRKKQSEEIYLDLSNSCQLKLPSNCDVAYLIAAISRIDDCEKNPLLAKRVNVTRQLELARTFFQQGIHVVFLSSNAVFNGFDNAPSESDIPCPSNIYGSLKLEAERRLRILATKYSGTLTIVRLTKVLSANVSLISNWYSGLLKNEKIEAFANVMVSPISLKYAIEGLKRCGELKYNGIIHLSGSEEVSYYELAKSLAQKNVLNSTLVQAVESKNHSKTISIHNRLSMTQSELIIKMGPQNLNNLLSDLKI